MAQVPPAGIIEMAVGDLQQEKLWVLADQKKELETALGAETARHLQVTFPLSRDAVLFYNLGLETARRIILNNPFLDDETRAKINL